MNLFVKNIVDGISRWVKERLVTKQDKLTAGEGIEITEDNVINNTKLPVWGEITGDIEEQEDLVEYVDDKISETTDVTIESITPTTTNFVEGETYSIQEAVKRTANLFAGYQGEIDNINSKIPNQATSSNQLADKAFVNATIATQTANFRGNWGTWNDVPTDTNLYPVDYVGSRKPTNNDYMVIQDASAYVREDNYIHIYTDVSTITRRKIYWEQYGITHLIDYANFTNVGTEYIVGVNNEITVIAKIDNNGRTRITLVANVDVVYNNILYSSGSVFVNNVGAAEFTSKNIYISQEQYIGQWRFMYTGDWDVIGKSGWKPQYRIGTAFTAAQQAAIDSTATIEKINQIDTNKTNITALQTDKLDKVYSSGKKVYGTAEDGSQKMYTAGSNIQFNNDGTISATDTIYDDTEVKGMIEDVADEVEAKQDKLTPGEGILLENTTIKTEITSSYIKDTTEIPLL